MSVGLTSDELLSRFDLEEDATREKKVTRPATVRREDMFVPPEGDKEPALKAQGYSTDELSDLVTERMAPRYRFLHPIGSIMADVAKSGVGLARMALPSPETPMYSLGGKRIQTGAALKQQEQLHELTQQIEATRQSQFPTSPEEQEAGRTGEFWKSRHWWTENVARLVPQVAMQVVGFKGMGKLGAIGATGATKFGNVMDEATEDRMTRLGQTAEEAMVPAATEAAVSTLIEGLTSALSLSAGKAFKFVPKKATTLKGIALNAISKGGLRAAGEPTEEAAVEFLDSSLAWLRGDPESFKNIKLRMAQAAATGLGVSGPSSVTQTAAESLSSISGMEDTRAENVAKEIDSASSTYNGYQKLVDLANTPNPSRKQMKDAGIKTPLNAAQREAARNTILPSIQSVGVVLDDQGKVVKAPVPIMKEEAGEVAVPEAAQTTGLAEVTTAPEPVSQEQAAIPQEQPVTQDVSQLPGEVLEETAPVEDVSEAGVEAEAEVYSFSEEENKGFPDPPPGFSIPLTDWDDTSFKKRRRIWKKWNEPREVPDVVDEKQEPKEQPTPIKPKRPSKSPAEKPSPLSIREEQRERLPEISTEVEEHPEIESLDPVFAKSKRVKKPEGLLPEETGAARVPTKAPGVVMEYSPQWVKRLGKKARTLFVGDLNPKDFEAKISRESKIRAEDKKVSFAVADLQRAARDVYGKSLTDEQSGLIDAALKGDIDISSLSEKLRSPVANMRSHVDALSRELIKSGVLSGKLEEVVSKNLGVYLNRSYQAFDDPNWGRDVPQDVRNFAHEFIRQEYPHLTTQQINNQIDDILYEAKDAGTPMALLARAKGGGKNLSILKKRKDIPKAIRALLGEYKDPVINYVRSVAKLSHLIETHRFLTEVRNNGLGKYLFEKNDPNRPSGTNAQIAADTSASLSPLNGLYTYPEIAKALTEMDPALPQGAAWRTYYTLLATTKYSKTILYPTSQIRNLLSGGPLLLAQGHFDVSRAWKATKALWTDIAKTDNKEWRDYVTELAEEGMIGTGVRSSELRDAINEAVGRDIDVIFGKKLIGVVRGIKKVAERSYQLGDEFPKLVAYESEKARYRKAYPEWTEEQVKKRASWIVRNTMPTYEYVPKITQILRRSPLVGSFVSFSSEIIRISINTTKLTAMELSDPKTRGIGAQRMVGSIAAGTMGTAIGVLTRYLYGVLREEEDDLRKFVASWYEHSPFMHFGRREDGSYGVVDLSYSIPWSYLQKPLIAILKGDDWKESGSNATKELLSPFVSPEMLTGAIGEVWFNKDQETGRPIYNEEDEQVYITGAIANHLWKVFEPGIVTTGKRIGEAYKGERGRDLNTEIVAALTGQRAVKIDIPQSIGFAALEFNDRTARSANILGRVLGKSKREKVSNKDIASAFKRANNARKKHFQNMHDLYHAAIRLGQDKEVIEKAIRSRNVSEDNFNHIVAGTYPIYAPTDIVDLKKVMDAVPDEDGKKLKEMFDDKAMSTVYSSSGPGNTEQSKETISKNIQKIIDVGISRDEAIKYLEDRWLEMDKKKNPVQISPTMNNKRAERIDRLHEIFNDIERKQEKTK